MLAQGTGFVNADPTVSLKDCSAMHSHHLGVQSQRSMVDKPLVAQPMSYHFASLGNQRCVAVDERRRR